MFIFNVNKNLFSRFLFTLMILIVFIVFLFSVYTLFIKSKSSGNNACVKQGEIFEITEKNYSTILKASNENIDNYVGVKVHLTGYIYRLINFNNTQFVIARDMLLSDNQQYLVIGFLAECENANDFKDGEWVDVYGTITKGDFSGPIALLKITSIERTSEPSNPYVSLPDDTYIPTANMF